MTSKQGTMKVYKFGGTSVGNPRQIRKILNLILREEPVWLVLSAISGTTDTLVAMSEAWKQGRLSEVRKKILNLQALLGEYVYNLFDNPETYQQGMDFLTDRIKAISGRIENPWCERGSREMVAEGELISTGLIRIYLDDAGIPVTWVEAPQLITKKADGTVDRERLARQVELVITLNPVSRVFLTQGFICSDELGHLDNLGRGGSDYTATLLGNTLDAEEIQIWTDVDGMHSGDPRVVRDTLPILELTYDEADELAYFGAKVLFPNCVYPAKEKNIPIRIRNTMNPASPGTLIREDAPVQNIKAVAGKDGITAIRIRSGRMLMAYGFLKKVFEIFERYKTPIDMITTSEVSVSLTIDNMKHLDQIVRELNNLGHVEVESGQSIICVVGDFMTGRKGVIRRVLDALVDVPLRMVSYGGSMNNVSLLVAAEDKQRAMQALNTYFFKEPQNHVYGRTA